MQSSLSRQGYTSGGGHHLRNKSSERLKNISSQNQAPIDIFIDVDTPSDPNVLMQSPSNASMTMTKGGHPQANATPMNNLEARIKQRQSALLRGLT